MEHIKRCKVCGHIFCYTDKDVQDQALNAVSSIFSGMAQIGSAVSGSTLNMHMAGSQAERVRNQRIDLNRCPNCRSTDLETITKEELEKIAAAEALKNGADIKINANASTASLLKRAEIFLEDSDWPTANAYCNAVLDVEPNNAEAYLGKMMAELQITKREKLADLPEPFDSNDNYKKIVRFGSEELVNEICGYVENIKNEIQYKKAKELLDTAKTEGNYVNLADKFKALAGYKDSEKISAECFKKAEILKEERERKAEEARIAAEKAKIEAEKARIAAERKAEADRIAAEIQAKKNKKIAAIVLPILAVIAVVAIIFITVIQPQNEYNAAVALMEEGKYEEAINAFEAMDGYKDSAEQIINCENGIKEKEYQSAVSLMESGKYEEAIIAFEAMGGYKDSAEQIINCENGIKEKEYQSAVSLMEEGKSEEAICIFESLKDYKDSETQIYNYYVNNFGEEIYNKIKNIKIGDVYIFGTYEQDNNTSNGKEEIEWIIIDKKGASLLLISKYALDCQIYHDTYEDLTWETCTLRKWLNKDFINLAFSKKEQTFIETTNLTNNDNPEYGTAGGNNTEDKIFLLSVDEIEKYFSSNSARTCEATTFAKAQGTYVSDLNGNSWWWTRSPGGSKCHMTRVNYAGGIDYWGGAANYALFKTNKDGNAVRPAMWIDLSVTE